jgi:NAD(P)-dependent dehydrogenase (short-subunit alcohol dehydrogenase family)
VIVAGLTILITGATDGLGKLVARRLAGAGARVLLHGRSQEKGDAVIREIGEATGSRRLEYYGADLASLTEVRRLATEVERRHERLDVLINNAGIGSFSGRGRRELSRDGYELRFAVNHLAHFELTQLLLPLILHSVPSRIVNVSSAGQYPIDFDDLMLEHGYDGWRAYGRSKLAQVMFTYELADRLAGTGVVVHCLHPATFMDTRMVRESRGSALTSVDEGADAVLYVATSPETGSMTGQYFDGTERARAAEQAYDPAARRRLWDLSLQLTRGVERAA